MPLVLPEMGKVVPVLQKWPEVRPVGVKFSEWLDEETESWLLSFVSRTW